MEYLAEIIIAVCGCLTAAGSLLVYKNVNKKSGSSSDCNNDINNSENSAGNINVNGSGNNIMLSSNTNANIKPCVFNIEELKDTIQILFIDDQDISVTKVLKNYGWKHVRKIGDIANLDDRTIKKADVIFVDINDIGKKGGFNNEGIGLAAAIKRKYPSKSVIIYSATAEHNIFDEQLNCLDGRLQKNAEPIEFVYCIEKHASEAN